MNFDMLISLSEELSEEVGELGSKVLEWEEAFTVLQSGSDIALATADWQQNPESQAVTMA